MFANGANYIFPFLLGDNPPVRARHRRKSGDDRLTDIILGDNSAGPAHGYLQHRYNGFERSSDHRAITMVNHPSASIHQIGIAAATCF